MLASFFQHLERHGAEWLLISGQATILYGAATFSEDVDLWVKPTEDNFTRFVQALRASSARYYKLTPPFTVPMARRHHGFHFTLPDPDTGIDVYLDVMGYPPRAASFEQANASAKRFDTRWGTLNTMGIVQLVEIKKTQRPRDYPIISKLAHAFLEDLTPKWSDEQLAWALENTFSLPELQQLLLAYPALSRVLATAPAIVQRASAALSHDGKWSPALEDELEEWLDQRVAILKRADRHFWRSVIDDLRQLRAQSALMPEGDLV